VYLLSLFRCQEKIVMFCHFGSIYIEALWKKNLKIRKKMVLECRSNFVVED